MAATKETTEEFQAVKYYNDEERNLRNQIVHELNPHFLFNALMAIRVMTKNSPAEACRLEMDFSNYLRAGIDAISVGGMVSLKEELKQIKAYLHIQQVRFPGKLKYEIKIEQDEWMLPRQLLLIFVENAARHGVCYSEAGGELFLEQRIINKEQILLIRDTGKGFDTSVPAQKSGGGIQRAYQMIRYLQGAEIDIESSTGAGTCVAIKLPMMDADKFSERIQHFGLLKH